MGSQESHKIQKSCMQSHANGMDELNTPGWLLERDFEEKAVRVQVDNKWNMSQQCVPAVMKVTCMLGWAALAKHKEAGLRKLLFSSSQYS